MKHGIDQAKPLTVNMIGLGYIGLPTAAVMADAGLNVIGVDINETACETINRGAIHIVEPGLEALVKKSVGAKTLRAQPTPEEADVYVIAVPTPFKGDFSPDLSYVKAACQSIAPYLKAGSQVILESTSPVGTTEKMIGWLQAERRDLSFPSITEPNGTSDVSVSYCPERVLPGKVIEELQSNSRLIGGVNKQSTESAAAFYKTFVKGECLPCGSRTAELAKLTENSFRDVNIAFANELSIIADRLDVNVWELIELSNRHPRVNILQPGCGVGGHCIAVDPWFIVDSAPTQAKLIRQAREINDGKPGWVVNKVQERVVSWLHDNPESSLKDIRIACFGLSFKPNIDDLRESPAVTVVRELCLRYPKFQIEVTEPHLDGDLPEALKSLPNLELVSLEHALTADVKTVLVAHDIFKSKGTLLTDEAINVAWPH